MNEIGRAKGNENIYSPNEIGLVNGRDWQELCIESVQDPGGQRDPGERSGNTESFITTGEWRAREIAREIVRQAARGVALRY